MPQGLGAGSPMDQRALILSLGDAGAEIIGKIGPRLPGNPRLVSCIVGKLLDESDLSGDFNSHLRLRFHYPLDLHATLDGLDRAVSPGTNLHVVVALGGRSGSTWAEHVARFRFLNLDLKMVHCVTPFNFEGAKRKRISDEALAHLRANETPHRIYANQDLFIDARPDDTFTKAFDRIGSAILAAIKKLEHPE
jgi:hypothetical protein